MLFHVFMGYMLLYVEVQLTCNIELQLLTKHIQLFCLKDGYIIVTMYSNVDFNLLFPKDSNYLQAKLKYNLQII
jgi:hypothetical protein